MGNKLSTPIIGVNVDAVYTGATAANQGSPFPLGTTALGEDGTEYRLVQAAETIQTAVSGVTNGPNALGIDEDFQASLMTTALALNNYELGFAPIGSGIGSIAQFNYFWARTAGANFNARVSASAAADTYLRTTITAGRLGTASTASAVVFYGAVIVTAASASTSAGNSVREVLLTKPRAIRQGNTNFVN